MTHHKVRWQETKVVSGLDSRKSRRSDRLGSVAHELYRASFDAQQDERQGENPSGDLNPLYNTIRKIRSRYSDPEFAGRGGMKEVYRVYDAKTARHVALARPLAKHGDEHFDAFLREAHLTARLQHPSVIDVFDIGVDEEGKPFFTMEFKRGQSLKGIIQDLSEGKRTEEFPLRTRLGWFLRICEAVAYAHSRRVLHLDIKPGNIQIGEFGDAKLCDWGLGVVVPDKNRLRDSEVLLDPDLYGPLFVDVRGTPAYMAPEQKRRQTKKTVFMDIYALGCVLHELVFLKPCVDDVKDVRTVDPGLIAIIKKATADDPTSRYDDAQALHDDISRCLNGFSPAVESANLFREMGLFWRRHREACMTVLCASLALAIFIAYFVWQLNTRHQMAEAARVKAVESGLAALAAKAEADEARLFAEDSLAKYLEKKNEAEVLDKKREQSIITMMTGRVCDIALVSGSGYSEAIEMAIKHYDDLVADAPEHNPQLWRDKFWLHFLSQDFAAAVGLLDDGRKVDGDLAVLARKYASQCNEEGYLPAEQFCDLLVDLVKRRRRIAMVHRMIELDQRFPRSMEERTQIVSQWVRINNDSLPGIEVTYLPSSQSIRLHGPIERLTVQFGLDRLSAVVKVNLLQSLRPIRLDLRETAIHDLSELAELDLMQVDIRQTPVTDLGPLRAIRSLRTVIVGKDQLPAKVLRSLPPWIEVIEEPNGSSL
ncbi:serine/threonine-protein kinase [Rhodopirellula sallentina]|uniref:Serine/threonine-protein kinase n=1 Tax=Rhodopirellula sallentina SM41 TaxID=1263870 RepID=M5UHY5_9BACT|nr:serine/threonine-protein kinase [Rhodopirellula sallentina]EMI55633.1 serine/threonine-protein kinase [Rhodopirellula sallentina SM41]